VRESPFCSVVVPTFNRSAALGRCLESLAALDYPSTRYEVIVVDDGGDGAAARVAEPWRDAIALTVVSQARTGPAAARNAGALHAEGELLAFTDDDCRPRPDWLTHLADRYEASPDGGVGGRTINALSGNPFSSTAQLIVDVGYEQNNTGPDDRCWFTTNNLAAPAAGFRAVGGFDGSFQTAEDRDFCSRWVTAGHRMAYEPRAIVEHAHDLTLRGFVGLHFAYGRGAYRYHRKQRLRGRPIRIEPSFYLSLARAPFARSSVRRRLELEGLLLVWHLANTAGFGWEWARSTLRNEA
jgi:glycosyltransferase involved in cell wall biosynthesis